MEGGDVVFYTLYGHLAADSVKDLEIGQRFEAGQQVARIGDRPVNGDWPPHLHFQIITDMLGFRGDFPGVASPTERELWLSLCPDPNLLLGIPRSCSGTDGGMDSEQIMDHRKRLFSPAMSISYGKPLQIVRGLGQYLYDETGRAFLDMVNNVCHVGHCHPRVVDAIRSQAAVLNTNTRYLHPDLVRYARRLTNLFPDPLRVCFLVCSGSEANELALRLARTHTGGQELVTLDGAYHGNTSALVNISSYKFDGPGGSGAPDWVHPASMPDGYRGRFRYEDPDRGSKYAQEVAEIVHKLHRDGHRPSFIHESLLGCGGQIILPPGYLAESYRAVRSAGGICIADEVQVGFGRVGTHFWGFETQDVVPDIVTLGKPIGNGHPLAAVITTPAVAESFVTGMEYFNTFGGNPVSCSVGLAVLDVIEGEGLRENARDVGDYLLKGLQVLRERHSIIGDVRGLGLFIGAELVRDGRTLEPAAEEAGYVINRMRDMGILLSTDGPLHNVLKIKPPLVFTRANADDMLSRLDVILAEDFIARR
jgi:4-aminobutyrate aminotransferase-like enzyme